MRKCGEFVGGRCHISRIVVCCRQLNQGWVGSNPPCNKGLKMSACRGILLKKSRSLPPLQNSKIQTTSSIDGNYRRRSI